MSSRSMPYSNSPDDCCSYLINDNSSLLRITTMIGKSYFTAVTKSCITIEKPPSPVIQIACLSGSAILLAIERSEEHTSELQSRFDLVCRLLLEKKNLITLLESYHHRDEGM